jgi:integral membrane protein (TIGR01906 family)
MDVVTKWIIPPVIGILLPVIIILSAIQIAAFNRFFFDEQLATNSVAENLNMSEEELAQVSDHIFLYLSGSKETFAFNAILDGEYQPVFNEKEIEHMVDVAALYQGAMVIRNVSLAVFLIGAVFLFIYARYTFFTTLFRSSVISLGLMVVLALIFAVSFNEAFNTFHHIFFANDLWLLNPATDNLIVIVPPAYFMALIAWITGLTVLPLAIIGGVSIYMRHRLKNKVLFLRNPKRKL